MDILIKLGSFEFDLVEFFEGFSFLTNSASNSSVVCSPDFVGILQKHSAPVTLWDEVFLPFITLD